jgi:hypothetical protein
LEDGPISHGKEDEEDCEVSDVEECDDEEDSHQEQDDAIVESDDEMEAQIDGLSNEVDGTRKRRMLPSSHVDLQNDIRVIELHKTDISAKQARDKISELISDSVSSSLQKSSPTARHTRACLFTMLGS